jgi:hypothetical protein
VTLSPEVQNKEIPLWLRNVAGTIVMLVIGVTSVGPLVLSIEWRGWWFLTLPLTLATFWVWHYWCKTDLEDAEYCDECGSRLDS